MNIESALNLLKDICLTLKEVVPGPNPWRWDEEFNVARIVFRQNDAAQVLSTLDTLFKNRYDFNTIEQSSSCVDAAINALLGIIPGQTIFTQETGDGTLLFAAWWPWGNELYVSLRVGMNSDHAAGQAPADLKKQIVEWLQIR